MGISVFKSILSLFSERTLIISGKKGVKYIKLNAIHYIAFIAVLAVIATYIISSIINIKVKEMGLESLYQEKKDLEKINQTLSEEINVLSDEVSEASKYLTAIGKDVIINKDDARKNAKKIENQNLPLKQIRYSKEIQLEPFREQLSDMFGKINDRVNYFVRVAKYTLPGSNTSTRYLRDNIDTFSFANERNFEAHIEKIKQSIATAVKIEKEIHFLPISQPLKSHRITGSFGKRIHPITNRVELHKGIDLVANKGAPVYAAGSGYIKFAGIQRGFGNIVEINHSNGIVTKYAHLDKIHAKKGAFVKMGELIGAQGDSGTRCKGSHLHYEVLVAGKHQNPYQFISATKNVKQQTASK